MALQPHSAAGASATPSATCRERGPRAPRLAFFVLDCVEHDLGVLGHALTASRALPHGRPVAIQDEHAALAGCALLLEHVEARSLHRVLGQLMVFPDNVGHLDAVRATR